MRSYRFYFVLLAMLLAMPMTVMAENEEGTHPSGVVVSPPLNIDSLTQVAEQGDVEAQRELGIVYEREDNYSEAAKWFRKAAEQGDAKDQFVLGWLYDEGRGEDYTEAAKWYLKAAEQGNEFAQKRLGDLYAEGKGLAQDYTEAAKWYRKAAEQGKGSAQRILGDFYAEGKGVKQDYAEAAKWYSKAAEQGRGTAQIKLGICYATGKGVEQNCSKATDLIFKGIKDLFGFSNLCLIILSLLLISFSISLFFYIRYRKAGLKKSQAIILSLIFWLGLISCIFLGTLIGFLAGFVGLSLLDYGDYFKFAWGPLALSLICSFINLLLKTKWIKSPKTSLISSEGENETPENTLMDGKKGHKIKINIATGHILSFAAFALAILVGLQYYWYVTKALGHEPFSSIVEDSTSILINLTIFLAALILGLIVMPLLHRLVWGWRNTSSRMDWKNMVIATYCNKPLKKSQYIKGAIAPFFILGLLPLLVSPFVNSIGMCLFGIVFISSTAANFMYVWKLRKEPRNCMIQDIKGEYAFFVLDEDQATDNE